MTVLEVIVFALLVAVAARFAVATTWDKTLRPPLKPIDFTHHRRF